MEDPAQKVSIMFGEDGFFSSACVQQSLGEASSDSSKEKQARTRIMTHPMKTCLDTFSVNSN